MDISQKIKIKTKVKKNNLRLYLRSNPSSLLITGWKKVSDEVKKRLYIIHFRYVPYVCTTYTLSQYLVCKEEEEEDLMVAPPHPLPLLSLGATSCWESELNRRRRPPSDGTLAIFRAN